MFLPKRHLLAILQSNPVRQSVRALSFPPESAILDFGDFEVDSFAAFGGGILNDEPNDARREKLAGCLRGEDDARPVSVSVLSYWDEGAWHDGESELCYGDRRWIIE